MYHKVTKTNAHFGIVSKIALLLKDRSGSLHKKKFIKSVGRFKKLPYICTRN